MSLPLNGWHKTVVAIGKALTGGVGAGRGFAVDYNASFSDLDYAVVLAPGPDRGFSSTSIIAKCAYDKTEVVQVSGNDIPNFTKNGTFKFGANASAPPDFLTSALQSAKAGINLNVKRDVSYEFRDVLLEQLTESAAEDAINAPACLAKLKSQRRVYVMRGRFLMRLLMAQTKDSTSSADLDLAFKLTGDPARVGFNVEWANKETWAVEQKVARPWFRIVGRMEKGDDGKFVFVENFSRH